MTAAMLLTGPADAAPRLMRFYGDDREPFVGLDAFVGLDSEAAHGG